jgi:dynein heavy chain
VQPQLKKCFEGISKLDFNSDLEIVGIISSEDEVVPLSGKIVPADAKGMVEKWLAQVEELMVRSVRDMCREAVAAYQRQPRAKWALQWPGQAVACASSIHWTTEVSTAIRSNEVAVSLLYF